MMVKKCKITLIACKDEMSACNEIKDHLYTALYLILTSDTVKHHIYLLIV